MSRAFPPKKRDWKPGSLQFGVFIRTPKGSVIELCCDKANPRSIGEAVEMLERLQDSVFGRAALAEQEKGGGR